MKQTTPSYSELLKDPRWQRKRLQILERDNFTCAHCFDSESTLHVHHCIYKPKHMPWDYDDKDLITLCMECHNAVEELKKAIGLHIGRDPIWRDGFASFEKICRNGRNGIADDSALLLLNICKSAGL